MDYSAFHVTWLIDWLFSLKKKKSGISAELCHNCPESQVRPSGMIHPSLMKNDLITERVWLTN